MQGFISTGGRLKWAGIAVMAVWAASCRQPEAPQYYGFQNVQVARGAGGQTTLATKVKLYNPNPFHLQLKRAEVDVLINGKHAGHSLLDSTIFIPPRDTFFVPVSVQLDIRSLFSNALSLLQGGQVNVALDGRVKVKKGLMTFNRPFHYESKEDLNSLLPSGSGF